MKLSSLIILTESIDVAGPLKTSWDSSTIFQTRTEPSLPPHVTARSFRPASIPVTLSWCPNLKVKKLIKNCAFKWLNGLSYKVSTYVLSSILHIFTARSAEQLNRECVFFRKANPVMASLWPLKVWYRSIVSTFHTWMSLLSSPLAKNFPSEEIARALITVQCPLCEASFPRFPPGIFSNFSPVLRSHFSKPESLEALNKNLLSGDTTTAVMANLWFLSFKKRIASQFVGRNRSATWRRSWPISSRLSRWSLWLTASWRASSSLALSFSEMGSRYFSNKSRMI